MRKKWWKNANIYQIYVRSFFDTNHDGIGDIRGITEKLDYIKRLGIEVIWISPHYDSPMDDNGYDVRDFYRVSSDYGSLEDFKRLIEKAHDMRIRVITDLVLNHTSDEHAWFVAACNPLHPEHAIYHDYYIWQKPKFDQEGNRMAPTRWMSWFGSSAWEYNKSTDEYYLHIFSKKMPDLNWRNLQMRADMKQMILWWLALGIDGFRVDASNHLEKNWDFPDDFPGYRHFSSLPKHHEYLKELGKEIFVPNDILTIGESGGATDKQALMYVGYNSNEFNMLIHFGHCWADIDNDNPKLTGKWAQGKLQVHKIKQSFARWHNMLKGKGWNIIYWHNHDHPRILSHYGNDSLEYHDKSAKMLAIALYFMPGTAICYQGEEIGMTNVHYKDISEFRDVEVYTEFNNIIAKGLSPVETLKIINARSRDNARTPMQWDDTANGGFSDHLPWMSTNDNYDKINVKIQDADPDSVLNLYKKILTLRVADENITHGDLVFLDIDSDENYLYLNKGEDLEHLVLCNFTDKNISIKLPNLIWDKYQFILGNNLKIIKLGNDLTLEPYDAFVFKKNTKLTSLITMKNKSSAAG